MKGIVFTEFLDHVEAEFSADMVDAIIDASDLPSGGVYTTVGTYDHAEIVALASSLCQRTGHSMADVIHDFGIYLGGRFTEKFRPFFEEQGSFFDFLETVENYIHVEVRKLYPDAQLPSIILLEHDGTRGKVLYRSPRGMDDLAAGLINASASYYGDTLSVEREHGVDDQGPYTLFTVLRLAKDQAVTGGHAQRKAA